MDRLHYLERENRELKRKLDYMHESFVKIAHKRFDAIEKIERLKWENDHLLRANKVIMGELETIRPKEI
jgi:hypothetical protein